MIIEFIRIDLCYEKYLTKFALNWYTDSTDIQIGVVALPLSFDNCSFCHFVWFYLPLCVFFEINFSLKSNLKLIKMSGNPMGISPMMQQPSPQQMQIQQGPPNPMLGPNHPSQAQIGHPNISQSQPAEHLDNISKVKSLVVPLRESLAVSFASNETKPFRDNENSFYLSRQH